MPEPCYRLQRHQGATTLRLYQIPLRWLLVERIAGPLIEHSWTWRLGNWLMAEADARYEFVHSIPIDDVDEAAIDPEWHRIWADDDAEDEADLSLIPAGLIESVPGIRGGEMVIVGTRVPAAEVAGYLADGATWDEVREMLPSLPPLGVGGEGHG